MSPVLINKMTMLILVEYHNFNYKFKSYKYMCLWYLMRGRGDTYMVASVKGTVEPR